MENIKFYKRAFISPGVVSYEDNNEGILLLQKDTIEKALNTFKNKPVILTHEGIEERGQVIDCYYDNETGYFICIFYVDNPYVQNLLDNEGYAVSCTYDCLEYGNAGIYHNIPYDEEATDIVFKNLAIVEKPRYQEAKEYINEVGENPKKNKFFLKYKKFLEESKDKDFLKFISHKNKFLKNYKKRI